MRRLIFILVAFFFAAFSNAQQLSHYSQYIHNGIVLNPAITGTEGCLMMGLDARKQWLGFENAPFTQTAFIHGAFGMKNGLGLILSHDVAGAESFLGVELAYAFYLKKTKNDIFSLGLSVKVMQYAFDETNFTTDLPSDPALSYGVLNAIQPDVSLGVYYKNKKLFWGIGMQQLLSSIVHFTPITFLSRHYFVSAGYYYSLNRFIQLEPSVLVKGIENLTISMDLNLKVIFDKKFFLGMSYRNTDAVVAMLGFTQKNVTLAYNYDLNTSRLFNYNSGSHELFLGYKICRGRGKGEPFRRAVPCPAYQ